MAQPRILLVDDEESMIRFLSIMLSKEGYEIRAVSSGKQALRELQQWRADLVISDIRMPEMDGIQLLAGIKAIDASIPVILLTAYASQETAIEAVNNGAFHYLIKQARNDEIKMVVRNALAIRQVKSENAKLRRQLKDDSSLESIIGSSEAMQRIFTTVRKIAATDSTILIGGESGTGKELIARAIHFMSGRADKPFVGVNCGALPENLLESELFGHVKGSFTGAIRDKEGLFKVLARGLSQADGHAAPDAVEKALWERDKRRNTALSSGVSLFAAPSPNVSKVNLGVVTGLLPNTGLTLPFISNGGTATALALFSVGVLLNISMARGNDWARQKAERDEEALQERMERKRVRYLKRKAGR